MAVARAELGATAGGAQPVNPAGDAPAVAVSGTATAAATERLRGDAPAVAVSGAAIADATEELRNSARTHRRLRRCVEQRGEVPVHFITLTTAIYHWQDLAQWLREYTEGTTALRDGRQDSAEPGEEKIQRTSA
jgi:hypothetical protein